METSPYDSLQEAARSQGLESLPPWSELPDSTQELLLRALRRRDLSRAIVGKEGLGTLEREVGIGEDRALRLHLLLTAVETLGAETGSEAAAKPAANGNGGSLSAHAGAFGHVFTELLDEATRSELVEQCWVYRADPLIPWDGLPHIQAGFEAGTSEELAPLAQARRNWDKLESEERLLLLAAGLRAVMIEYTRGHLPFPMSPRSIWGNAGILRKLRRAAEQDRINLLSDTAFESLGVDLPRESFRGIEVLLDGEEAFLRRSALSAEELAPWSEALAQWKPLASDAGEAVFAWHWGGAVAVPERPLADHLEDWLQTALARVAFDAAA